MMQGKVHFVRNLRQKFVPPKNGIYAYAFFTVSFLLSFFKQKDAPLVVICHSLSLAQPSQQPAGPFGVLICLALFGGTRRKKIKKKKTQITSFRNSQYRDSYITSVTKQEQKASIFQSNSIPQHIGPLLSCTTWSWKPLWTIGQ